jgi:nitrilase
MIEITKVAVAQLTPVYLNKPATVEKACKAIAEASKEGARLIVFPEVFISGYPDWVWLLPNNKREELNKLYIKLVENAVSLGDESTKKLEAAAKKSCIHVVMGMQERNSESSNASLYNSLLFINDRGEVIGRHRKIMPTGGERLIWAQGDGSSLTTYNTSIGKIGGLICWENYMPLARTALFEKGVEILAAPTWDKSQNWLDSMRHIAREGGTFVLSACSPLRVDDIPDELDFRNLYPRDREWINGGRSSIICPLGNVLAGPIENEEIILYADLQPNAILEAKRMFDVAGHYARPDIFNFSVT